MSLYDDLGVRPDATTEQIIAAYRRSAKEHHPDAGGDPEAFARIQRAADILRDPEKRARYDATGSTDNQPANEDAEAASVLCEVFRQVRDQFRDKWSQVDLALQLQSGVRQLIDGVQRERARLEGEQRDNEDARYRLRHRGKGADFLRTMLEDEGAKLERGLAGLERKERVMNLALDLAKGYDWVVDIDDFEMVLLPGSPGSTAAALRRR